MAHAKALFLEDRCKCTVLAKRPVRHTADRVIGRNRHGNARARRDAVVRPWIVRTWIAQSINLGDEPEIHILQSPSLQEGSTKRYDLWGLGVYVSCNAIGPFFQMPHIICVPGRAHGAVGICV